MVTIPPKGRVRIRAEGNDFRMLEHDAMIKAREYFTDKFELSIAEEYIASEANGMSDSDPKFVAHVVVEAVLPPGEG